MQGDAGGYTGIQGVQGDAGVRGGVRGAMGAAPGLQSVGALRRAERRLLGGEQPAPRLQLGVVQLAEAVAHGRLARLLE